MSVRICLLALLAVGCAGPRVGRTVDARVPRDRATSVVEVRTVGPFYERVVTSAGDVRTSLRPLLHTAIEVPEDRATLREVLWPVYAARTRQNHRTWRFLTVFGTDFDTTDPHSRHYLWAFPVWFHGRGKDGAPYAALFPLGGTLRDFLAFDVMRFALFPLWMETQRAGVHGRNLLWPVFGWAEGAGVLRWRVFPLYGYSRKEGAWRRHFALWPIWSYARYERAPLAGYEWILVPVFGRAERGRESSWYVLPPFFQVSLGRACNAGWRRILAPWPLVRIEDGPQVRRRHFWPLYATTQSATHRRTHLLWPFFLRTWSRAGRQEREAWSLAPIFHHSVARELPAEARRGPADGPTAPDYPADPVCPPVTRTSYTRLWPLFSQVTQDGSSFLRVPDFSLQRRVGAMERNLLQMGTLYTRGVTTAPRSAEHDFLWGLFRHVADGGAVRWSVLGGLLERTQGHGRVAWRYLWFLRTHHPEDGRGRDVAPPPTAPAE